MFVHLPRQDVCGEFGRRATKAILLDNLNHELCHFFVLYYFLFECIGIYPLNFCMSLTLFTHIYVTMAIVHEFLDKCVQLFCWLINIGNNRPKFRGVTSLEWGVNFLVREFLFQLLVFFRINN
jgi:hypothetical protein